MRGPQPRRQTSTLLSVFAVIALGSSLACSPAPSDTTEQGEPSTPAETPRNPSEAFDLDAALLHLKIRGALLEHLKVDALGVDVDVEGDKVILSGEVDEEANKKLAKEAALAIDGVRQVDNRLTIVEGDEGTGTPVAEALGAAERELADALLETRVKTALLSELGKTGFAIHIEAVDGSVILRGRVPDEEHRELALKVASETKGADVVHDLLEIEP